MKLLMISLCKGTCSPVTPLSKGRGAVPPSCTHVPESLTMEMMLHNYNCFLSIIIPSMTDVHVMLKRIECER